MNNWAKQKDNFTLPANEGTDKLCSLKDAIREMVKPNMYIHFAQTGARWPTAAIFEIARQFWGTDPKFTLVGISMNFPQSVLVHGKLVKKLISSYFGEPYLRPGPNGVFQRAFRENTLEFENWSILTLPLRFEAAAKGLPFITTNSLIGSSMEKDNPDSFKVIDDPFGSGKKVGILKPIAPDISIQFGVAADKYGNTLLCPPVAEDTFGAMASKNGVIVMAENLVDTAFIRKHSHLPFLPGDYVKKVCHVPFGGHPSGLSKIGMPEFDGYTEDKEKVDEVRMATKDPEKIEAWIQEWVLGCKDHGEYLKKLGRKRLLLLKGLSAPNSWEADINEYDFKPPNEYNKTERMLVFAANTIQKKILKAGHHTVLAGAGMANLAAWLAVFHLKQTKYDVELMAEVGMYGYNPRPFDPSLFNQCNFYTCKSVSNIPTVMGLYMSGANNQCVGIIGFGQIDMYGNVNTTLIPGKTYIAGSGGANDIASSAKEVIVIGTQSKRRFLDKIPYITSPGTLTRILITNLGIYEKKTHKSEFVLTGYFNDPDLGSEEKIVRNIKDNCGFDLKIAEKLTLLPEPCLEDIEMLRYWDPNGYFLEV